MTEEEIISSLARFDTPTICNALEMLDARRRDFGYTKENLICLHGEAMPIVGFARTATVRSLGASEKTPLQIKQGRLAYYDYVRGGRAPRIVVMQDLDGRDYGRGAFWGEFNSKIHRALGCVGIVTDGTIRDVETIPRNFPILCEGLRPSHAHVHIVDYASQVNVFGMVVSEGDLIHADRNGAVCFPHELGLQVIERAHAFMESERPIFEACAKPSVTFEEIAEIYMRRSAG